MDDYSVNITGQVEKIETKNSTSVINAKFGIVVHNVDDAIAASTVAKDILCKHLNVHSSELFISHIDIIPVDER